MGQEYELDKWETGELGMSEAHAVAVDADKEQRIDDLAGLQMISIRLKKSMIEELKALAAVEGIGYQPLIRRCLERWIAHEFRAIAIAQLAKAKTKVTAASCDVETWSVEQARKTATG